jgi:hypothetical protein
MIRRHAKHIVAEAGYTPLVLELLNLGADAKAVNNENM